MALDAEFAVRAETKTGDVFTLERHFKSQADAEGYKVRGAKYRRVWIEKVPPVQVEVRTKPEPSPDDPPPYPWTVQWRGNFAYIVDADGKKIASLLGSKKRKEYVARVLGSLR